jgi:signal peptidase I
VKFLDQLYALLLYSYPREFRNRFGSEMRQLFRDRCRDTWANPTAEGIARFLFGTTRDWIRTSFRERTTSMFTSRLAYTAALLIALLATPATILRAYVVSGGSMEGTLRIGDHLIVNKLVGNLHHGDLVVFPSPLDSNQTFIKRVVGLPGDRIRIANKQVFRDGQLLTEAYASHITNNMDARRDNYPQQGEAVVPPGMIFLLGDNRDVSFDSRYWGFVPQSSVIARPWFVYWSRDPVAHATRWDRTPLVVGGAQ